MKPSLAALLILAASVPFGLPARAEISVLTSRVYSVNVSGASAEAVIRMIAQKAGVPVQVEGDLSKRVSYNFTDTTLENALARMATDVGFEYSLRDNVLYVSKGGKTAGSGSTAHMIELKYAEAEDMSQKIQSFLKEGETSYVDKQLNNIVLMSSQATFERTKDFIALFDRQPKQILIEAKIVETNKEFGRSIGFQAGDLSDQTMNNNSKVTGGITPAVSTVPNFFAKYKLGVLNNRNLDLRLIAAENKGDAKIISRPRVVTINNTRAVINSGLIYTVKTLSSVPSVGTGSSSGSSSSATTPSGTTGGVVTGGLERVEAGLDLGVLPTIVDTSHVRLLVDVNNSEPDTSTSVDGIPGITRNAANTSIIVPDGKTAVIAGLIKHSANKSRTGVPFLSDIPVLGLLFRNDSQSDKNNELMIFITPRIIQNAEVPEHLDGFQEEPESQAAADGNK
jgi:type IV pilus assembly protein PilQ